MMANDRTSPPERDFTYTRADFERIRRLIYDHAGIALSPHKFNMVYSRLARRLRLLRLDTFDAYLRLLEGGDEQEWQAFVNALTTNLTAFFREAHHFELLKDAVRTHAAGGRPLSIWCAASSTGEEAYSLAMTVVDALGPTPPVRILASDVDTQVLAKAEAGVYPIERVERLAPDLLRRFFLKGRGAQHGWARVRPELRRLVEFRPINLLAPQWPVEAPVDFIFCRNVMIYFDKPTQRRILERFAALLAPGGLLFAGHSESLHHAADLFRLRGKTVYELAGPAARRPREGRP